MSLSVLFLAALAFLAYLSMLREVEVRLSVELLRMRKEEAIDKINIIRPYRNSLS